MSIAQGKLVGKVAIITGGARGIGEAIVRLFTKHGAKVIIADVEDKPGKILADSLSRGAATYVHCDVTREQDVSDAVDVAVKNYGQLDIMFNNAGTLDTAVLNKSIAEYDINHFERVMAVNVKGVMLGLKHAGRIMMPAKNGCIISTASVAGIVGGSCTHAYTASKHAIVGLTKNAAAELGKYGIRVNCVSPFGVATLMAKQTFMSGATAITEEEKDLIERNCNKIGNLNGPLLKAVDIAEAGLFLASEEAKYVSGHNLVVDGGFTVVNHGPGFYRP